jgi:SAM-dependent methyltransferase
MKKIFLKDKNPKFKISINYIYPCLKDKTEKTLVEPIYFFQDTWAAKKIFEAKPKHHYDIGSAVKTIGIISQFVPTTMIDIRPIDVSLNGLFFMRGSILNIPFKNNSIESVSSLCVVEHIGLGRYGDVIDPYGSEKAIKELKRVLKKGGNLYFSVPVDEECRIYFNAHRAFTRSYILELFNDLKLIEEKYIYGKKVYDKYDKEKGFGTGLFHFKK